MNKSNKQICLVIIGVFIISTITNISFSNAVLPFETDSNWEWPVNSGEHFMYHIVDNVFGDRYEAFNASGIPWGISGLDALNLTRFKYNITTNKVEETAALFQCASSSSSPAFWQLSFYNETLGQTGDLILAFPVIPVSSGTGTLDLNAWGIAMTSEEGGGTSYAGSFHLYEYNVNGNELQIFNSTTGKYVNMTYDNTGHLISANSSVDIDMGGPVNVIQTIIAITPELSLLNPIDETQLAVEVNDMLIYDQIMAGTSYGFKGYNITFVGPTTEDFQGGQQAFIGANATQYNWDKSSQTWIIDEDKWDDQEEEWKYAFIDQSIGGGNDFGQFRGMDGPFSFIYPEGTTGQELYDFYYPRYSNPEYGGLTLSEVGDWSLLLSSPEGNFIYLELNGSSGILMNGSYSSGGFFMMNILSTDDDLPEPIGSDEVMWNTNVGVIQYYEINTVQDDIPVHYFEKAVINNIYTDEVQVDMYGEMMFMSVSIVNATIYHLIQGTNTWVEVPMDYEVNTYEYEDKWGIGNNQGPVHLGGETARIYQDTTNGYTLNSMYSPIGAYYGMTYFYSTANKFEMHNGSFTGDDIYLQIELDTASGWVTHQMIRLPNEDEGPGESQFNTIERWLIQEIDLPYNQPPLVIATPEPDHAYLPGTNIVVTISDNKGIVSVVYRWDQGTNTSTTATFTTSLPVTAGEHQLELWVEDTDGNIVHDILIYTTDAVNTTTTTETTTETTTTSDTTTTTTTGVFDISSIPGYTGFSLLLVSLASIAILYIRKRK